MSPHDRTRAMARNCAVWHQASVAALGLASRHTPSLWWRDPGGSPIYLAASTLDPDAADEEVLAALERVANAWGSEPMSVYECWGRRDLAPSGLGRAFQNPWYPRPAGTLEPRDPPAGLAIERVADRHALAEFEVATCAGFETPALPVRFSQHAEATLDDPGMSYLNGRVGGDVVASVIAYATDDMLGIYGISTLPAHRRRGYGTALVHAAVALRPDLPCCVFPDPPSVPMYDDFGFAPAGEIGVWRSG